MSKKKNKAAAPKKKNPNSLDVVRKAIEKKYGNVVATMGDIRNRKFPTVSTGSIGLDLAMGKGGFALGRVYEVYGPPSGGKTTLTMSLIAQAQKRGMKCLFIDAERAADASLFEAMGVDIDALIYVEGHTGEQNLDIAEQYIKSGEIDVVVIDSVSALIPTAEADAAMDDQFMGLLARMMSKAMRKFVPLASTTNTMIVFINQVRSKIGSYGDPEITTGGAALEYTATGRIKVSGGDTKGSRIVDKETGEVIGHITTFITKKNKLNRPWMRVEIPLIYGKGYDIYSEVIKFAVDLGIIDKSGAWYSYEEKNIAQGEENTTKFLKENEDIYLIIREDIVNQIGLSHWYEQNS